MLPRNQIDENSDLAGRCLVALFPLARVSADVTKHLIAIPAWYAWEQRVGE
jgi:hypothetical protein